MGKDIVKEFPNVVNINFNIAKKLLDQGVEGACSFVGFLNLSKFLVKRRMLKNLLKQKIVGKEIGKKYLMKLVVHADHQILPVH